LELKTTEFLKKYRIGDTVKGEVTKFNPFGAFIQLDKDIHGLAHISELNRYAGEKKLEEVLKIGKSYKFRILSIEPKSHRMGLSPFVNKEEEKGEKKISPDKKTKKSTSASGKKKGKSLKKEEKTEKASKGKQKKEKKLGKNRKKSPAKKTKTRKK